MGLERLSGTLRKDSLILAPIGQIPRKYINDSMSPKRQYTPTIELILPSSPKIQHTPSTKRQYSPSTVDQYNGADHDQYGCIEYNEYNEYNEQSIIDNKRDSNHPVLYRKLTVPSTTMTTANDRASLSKGILIAVPSDTAPSSPIKQKPFRSIGGIQIEIDPPEHLTGFLYIFFGSKYSKYT